MTLGPWGPCWLHAWWLSAWQPPGHPLAPPQRFIMYLYPYTKKYRSVLTCHRYSDLWRMNLCRGALNSLLNRNKNPTSALSLIAWHWCPTYGRKVVSYWYYIFHNLCRSPWLTRRGVLWYVCSVACLIRRSKDYVYGIWVYKALGLWKGYYRVKKSLVSYMKPRTEARNNKYMKYHSKLT